MSFCMSAPEITSAQIYSGPGPEPMLAAAAAWDGLTTEMDTAANSFHSLISGLTAGPWQGPAASAMTETAARYIRMVRTAGAEAANAAAQATEVAGIFEAAKTAITPPHAVEINRSQFVSLVRSNFLGLNAPAIATAEGIYDAMWANNVATMEAYHGAASAVAAKLTASIELPAAGAASAAAVGFSAAATAETALSTFEEGVEFFAMSQAFIFNNLAEDVSAAFTDLGEAGIALLAGDILTAAGEVVSAGWGLFSGVVGAVISEILVVPVMFIALSIS